MPFSDRFAQHHYLFLQTQHPFWQFWLLQFHQQLIEYGALCSPPKFNFTLLYAIK